MLCSWMHFYKCFTPSMRKSCVLCDIFCGKCVTPALVSWLVKHTCAQPVTGLVSRLVFTELIPPDGCRRTERRLSTTLAAKGCVLSTQQERSWGYPIRAYRWLGAMRLMFPALYILRPKKNLRQLESCQPSSQNEWSVDEWMCCQITTPGRTI